MLTEMTSSFAASNNCFGWRVIVCILTTALACLLAGCTGRPMPIAASDDGKYVAFATTESGSLYFLTEAGTKSWPDDWGKSTVNLSMTVVNVNSGAIVHNIEIDEAPVNITTTRDYVAYTYYCESDKNKHLNVVFCNNGRKKTIEYASMPVLAQSKSALAYWDSKNKLLMCDYFRIGEVKKMRVENTVPIAFSPNGKRLLCCAIPTGAGENTWALDVWDTHSGSLDRMVEFDAGKCDRCLLALYSQWIDNRRILFQRNASESSRTTDIYVIDDRGNEVRITDNSKDELSPMSSRDGTILFLEVEPDYQPGAECTVCYAKTEKGFWREYRSKLKAQWIRVCGDNLVYAANKGNVYCMPLEDVMSGCILNIRGLSGPRAKTLNAFRRLREVISG